MANIVCDEDVFNQFKEETSKKAYRRTWLDFREYNPDVDFEEGPPGEEVLAKYFAHLRNDKAMASSTMWTLYSYINSVMQRKYSKKLQEYPRLKIQLKSYDTDIKEKAQIFEEDQLKQFMVARSQNAYWLVRQVICILAFFGGLRHGECMSLLMEKLVRGKDGFTVHFYRLKQRRTDRLESKFLVPRAGGFAATLPWTATCGK